MFWGQMFFTYNLSKNDLLNRVHFKDPFLKEVLNIWTEVNFEPQLKPVEHFHSQTLWFNSVFRIGKKTFFYSDWSRNGINQVRDLLKDDNSFLSYQEFKAKFKEWLKECKVVQESYILEITTALGLRPDTSSLKLQINYCLLQARFFVWCCKVKGKTISWINFKQILKRNFEIETAGHPNKLELKKWTFLSPFL